MNVKIGLALFFKVCVFEVFLFYSYVLLVMVFLKIIVVFFVKIKLFFFEWRFIKYIWDFSYMYVGVFLIVLFCRVGIGGSVDVCDIVLFFLDDGRVFLF